MCRAAPCRYGAHLSKEQVAELVAPHPHIVQLLHSRLKHHSVSSFISVTHNRNSLKLTGMPGTKLTIFSVHHMSSIGMPR